MDRVGTGERAVMSYGWESNCRSGVALAMRQSLSGLSIYRLNGLLGRRLYLQGLDRLYLCLIIRYSILTRAQKLTR